MFEKIYLMLADNFFERQNKGTDEWLSLKLSVPLRLLNELYLKFIRDGVAPIETLSLEQKQKYWDIALRYYTDKEQRIKAMKAAYTLSLITSND